MSPALPHDSVPIPVPPDTQTPHLLNQADPSPSYKGYADLYLSDPDNAPVFEEMVGNEVKKHINTISKYDVSPPVVVLNIIPYKVLKKRRKTICQGEISTIKRTQLDTSVSARFLLTALHSVSQAIIHSHTARIALYKNYDKA